MLIFAIDPGNHESGFALYEPKGNRVIESGVLVNRHVFVLMGRMQQHNPIMAIEMMAARGMPVSNDEMETLLWIGRFQQAWYDPEGVILANRRDVKLFICDKPTAKDANVRAALIEMVGKPGTKKKPGPTYGVTSHAWPALAVAVYVNHKLEMEHAAARTANRGPAHGGRPRVRI